jgi:hypothetical protein
VCPIVSATEVVRISVGETPWGAIVAVMGTLVGGATGALLNHRLEHARNVEVRNARIREAEAERLRGIYAACADHVELLRSNCVSSRRKAVKVCESMMSGTRRCWTSSMR